MKDLFGNIDEEGMYQMAVAVPLAEKIESAIMLIRSLEGQALQLSDDGFYVCDSFGKDSTVMRRLYQMSGVKYQCHHNNTTIDPPELLQFGKKHHPDAIWHSVGTPLPLYMAQKSNGPPTRLARWCCEIYKEQGGTGVFKAIGVRAEESPRRKGLWKQITNNRNTGLILCPILYWTERDVWQFIREQELPYCSLYDEGFKRLGCVGCPMGGPEGQKRDFARWPKHEKLWRRGFKAYWSAWKGVPRLRVNKQGNLDRWIERMDTVDDLWKWWVSGKANEGDAPDCQGYLW
jgi:phosphoadenosine phosphosulfate reductase